MEKMKIFCLPYAGGTKNVYREWVDKYADLVEIIPLEYSGHASRFDEELFTSADDMADDISTLIIAEKPTNYAIYGHSMGSLISLLTTVRLEERYQYAPKAVIIGGTRPPHLSYKDVQIGHLPKNEFIQKIFDMGQMDSEIMEEPELIDILYEIISADIMIGENYTGFSELPKIKADLFVMTGLQDDEAPQEDMEEWKDYSDGKFELKTFNSEHFFPFNCPEFHDYFAELIRKLN